MLIDRIITPYLVRIAIFVNLNARSVSSRECEEAISQAMQLNVSYKPLT